MAEQKIACHRCQNIWSIEPPLARRAECPKCQSDARVCLNCVFYDRGSYRECREEQAEWVKEKAQGNFCSYFSARPHTSSAAELTDTKAKLDALFSTAPAPCVTQSAASLAADLARFMQAKKN